MWSAKYDFWKTLKDAAAFVVAGAGAVIATNAIGIANQCPDATITVFGVTIGLKALIQFANNYRKNS
jgi:hypothetical protein